MHDAEDDDVNPSLKKRASNVVRFIFKTSSPNPRPALSLTHSLFFSVWFFFHVFSPGRPKGTDALLQAEREGRLHPAVAALKHQNCWALDPRLIRKRVYFEMRPLEGRVEASLHREEELSVFQLVIEVRLVDFAIEGVFLVLRPHF